jgi:hypothetical protein
MKYNSAKRPEGFEGSSNAKAPDSFIAPVDKTRAEVLETITPLPAASSTINLDTVSATPLGGDEILAALPSSYRDSMSVPELIQEEKEEFTYEIPENRRLKFRELVEQLESKKTPDEEIVKELETKLIKTDDHSWESIDKLMRAIAKKHNISPKKLHDDFKDKNGAIPDVWVENNVVKEQVKSPMEILATKIAAQEPKEEGPSEEALGAIRDGKLNNLEKMVFDLRKMMLEVAQASGTMVHAIGDGTPGSGETFLGRMEDVKVPNLRDGDTLVWDDYMKVWVNSSDVGGTGDNFVLNRLVTQLTEKVQSLDDRVAGIAELQGLYLRLEDSTQAADGRTIESSDPPEFIDRIPDGDTTRFVVTKDPLRGVYSLDGVAQPTVQLPRGDLLEFDLSQLAEPDRFILATAGAELAESIAYTKSPTLILLNTSHLSTDITKIYYRDSEVNGLGWVIAITDN